MKSIDHSELSLSFHHEQLFDEHKFTFYLNKIKINTHSISNNLHKLTLLLLDKYYIGWRIKKASIDMISDTKAFRASLYLTIYHQR